MGIESFGEFAAILSAITLCAERIVATAKSFFPRLAEEALGADGKPDRDADKRRRLGVQFIAFAASWVTTAFLAVGGSFDLFGTIAVGSAAEARPLPVWLIALIATGGTALWSNAVAYTSALRDEKQRLAAVSELINKAMHKRPELAEEAASRGVLAADVTYSLVPRQPARR